MDEIYEIEMPFAFESHVFPLDFGRVKEDLEKKISQEEKRFFHHTRKGLFPNSKKLIKSVDSSQLDMLVEYNIKLYNSYNEFFKKLDENESCNVIYSEKHKDGEKLCTINVNGKGEEIFQLDKANFSKDDVWCLEMDLLIKGNVVNISIPKFVTGVLDPGTQLLLEYNYSSSASIGGEYQFTDDPLNCVNYCSIFKGGFGHKHYGSHGRVFLRMTDATDFELKRIDRWGQI